MSDFRHIRAAVFSQPWAIMEDRFHAVVEVVERRLAGVKLSPEEIAAYKGERTMNGVLQFRSLNNPNEVLAGPGAQPTGGAIAVIPISGIIAQHASAVDDISGPGGTSTERVGASFRAAVDDPRIKAIVFNIDSPGGSVSGVQALADEIYRARGKKPIIAQVNSLAASAAYWIAASADEIVMTPGSQAGSIGVYVAHADISGASEKAGMKVTFVSAGKYKVEGNPYEPLGSEAAGAMQKMVDSYYGDFTSAVARGRGVAVEDVRAGFGEGRVVKDRDAVKSGMADRIDTLSGTISRIANGQKPSSRARAAAGGWPQEFVAARSPTIRVETADDGTKTYFVQDEWPQTMILADCVLDQEVGVLSFEPQPTLTITVHNGMAIYEIAGSRIHSDGVLEFAAVLKDSIYEPPPGLPPTQAAAERDAYRRRRHAARMRKAD